MTDTDSRTKFNPKVGVLCGTDLTEGAECAVEVSVAIAKRLNEALLLAHAVEVPARCAAESKLLRAVTTGRRRELRQQADAIRRGGVSVEISTAVGQADEVLCGLARTAPRRMIVLGRRGERSGGTWLLGSVTERTAQCATTPTLVVRDGAPIVSWARGERPLRIFVCFNFTQTAQAALRWVKELRALGRCELVIGLVDLPFEQYLRLGGDGPLPFERNPPEIQKALERDVQRKAGELLGKMPFRVRVEASQGRMDVQLAEMAKRERADLIVVGSHQYRGFGRLWHTSVSCGLLHEASTNVAVVPLVTDQARGLSIAPPLRRVLVPTDFSELGNTAISHAYSLLRTGGTVYLFHVAMPSPGTPEGKLASRSARKSMPADRREVLTALVKLRALIPPEAADYGISTQVEVLEDWDVAKAICQAAERLAVDLVCLGTHGRSGLSKLVMGSIAQGVMTKSPRPLLVVRPLPE